jgi:hypothetical protein
MMTTEQIQKPIRKGHYSARCQSAFSAVDAGGAVRISLQRPTVPVEVLVTGAVSLASAWFIFQLGDSGKSGRA